jgi:hypothetical protein
MSTEQEPLKAPIPEHITMDTPGGLTFTYNWFSAEQRVTPSDNGTRVTYQLSAISTQNKKIKLLGGLNSPDEVRFLEQKIEEQLGIKDRPVEGEMDR